jgi:hypothetical protein
MVERVLAAMGASAVRGNYAERADGSAVADPAAAETETQAPVYATAYEMREFAKRWGYNVDVAPRTWNRLREAATIYDTAEEAAQDTAYETLDPDPELLSEQAWAFIRLIAAAPDGSASVRLELEPLLRYMRVVTANDYEHAAPSPVPGMGWVRWHFLAHFLNEQLQLQDQLPVHVDYNPLPTPDMPVPPPDEFNPDMNSPLLDPYMMGDHRLALVTSQALRRYVFRLALRSSPGIDFRPILGDLVRHVRADLVSATREESYMAYPGIYMLGGKGYEREWGMSVLRFAEVVHGLENDEQARTNTQWYEGLARAIIQRYLNDLHQPGTQD